ncbi:ATPase, AAA-type, core, P-loop containing nucleoside triphosphate hydrolase [Artemisia annua]|uniref:ATPase, AAA-type, core, P-loop containing nucleoside triphosphate hydrolase n=1 Tax=Artemisia annua TaxID=35608 RepID=A0A2U1Q027_ARTAN|nr:ATPase, AAA-type, core, P-loop containing nucleoside triphosphate hydrolase [Artemisia annua]
MALKITRARDGLVTLKVAMPVAMKVTLLWGHEDIVTTNDYMNLTTIIISCGDERTIIFTTNRKDKLDPALLCPGPMGVHIHMVILHPEWLQVVSLQLSQYHSTPAV